MKRTKRSRGVKVAFGREIEKTEEDRLFEHVFSINLILKEILKNLEKEDLLRTSLVSKHWNLFSREVLRQNKHCLAIVSGNKICHNLAKLNVLLSNSETVPFCGISIDVPTWTNHSCPNHTDLSELMNNVLSKIDFKMLSIQILCTDAYTECIALDCLRKIIMEKASLLERLRIDLRNRIYRLLLEGTFAEFLGLDLQGQWLPNVRILEFPCEFVEGFAPMSIVKSVVDASPKLQILYGDVDEQVFEFIAPMKAVKVLKEFNFKAKIKSLSNCATFYPERLQLDKLRLSISSHGGCRGETRFYDWDEADRNKVSKILKRLLKGSQDSLKNLRCDIYELTLMTFRWNIPVLKNVNYLSLGYGRFDGSEDYRFLVLRNVEWAKYFPNLKEVDVTHPYCFKEYCDVHIGQTIRESDVELVCESVEVLRCLRSLDAKTIQFFQHIFPNVKEFHFKSHEDGELDTVWNELWTAWPDLEFLDVSILAGRVCNHDSAFLGISQVEADYLLNNVGDLKSLEIVPTSSSIFNSRKLKKLVIHVRHDRALCCLDRHLQRITTGKGSSASDVIIFLSRLAGQCAFARMAGLEVEIYRGPYHMHHSRITLNHITPFVKCVKAE